MSSSSAMSAVWLLVVSALLAPMVLARGVSVASDAPLSERISAEIENFRALMPAGQPSFGIPALEPLTEEQIPIDVKASILTAAGSINDLVVSGMSSFVVSKIEQTSASGSSGRVSVSIEVPSVSATTEYDLNGKLKVGFISTKITGKSPVSASVSGVKASADIDLTINDDNSVTVDNISNVNYDINKIKVKVNQMNGIVNSLINKLIPNLIKSNRAKIINIVQTLGKDNINKYFDMVAGKIPSKSLLSVGSFAEALSSEITISPEAERIIEQIAYELH